MGTQEWLALGALILAILVPSAMGIKQLGRVEAVLKQVKDKSDETHTLVTEHAKTCDPERAVHENRLETIDARLSNHDAQLREANT